MRDIVNTLVQEATPFLSTLESIFNIQNLSFILGLIGAAGTAWTVFQSRVRLSVRVIKCSKTNDRMLAYMTIQNKSRLPISIEKISLILEEGFFPCVEVPTRVETQTYYSSGTVTGRTHYYNINLLLNLGSLAGTSGYILFELPKGIDIPDATTLTFQISPNRGKAIEMKCQIPQ